MIDINLIHDSINRFIRQQTEYTEKVLAEIIEKYDFLVGSKKTKHKLQEILPDGANIVYSPYIEDSTIAYVIKKFDIKDLFSESYKVEQDKK